MIDILNLTECERIITEIESSSNVKRKQNEFASFECYSGNIGSYVQESIKKMFPLTWQNYTIAEYSVLKKIVDKKAKAYKTPPMRKLSNDNESKNYQEILKKFRFNDAMREIDKSFNQHKYCGLLMFKELNELGEYRLKFMPLRPYEFDVVRCDEDGSVECLILSYPSSQITGAKQNLTISGEYQSEGVTEKIYTFWTEENHVVVKVETEETKDGEKKSVSFLEIDDNPNNLNPWGVIPFVFLPYDFSEDYPVASPLASQAVNLNAIISVYLTSSNMQVGTLTLSYPEDMTIDSVAHGLMTAIKLPQSLNPNAKETKADYISPGPNLTGHREAIITYLSMILDEQGINSNQIVNANAENFNSGFDRLLASADVQNIIEENQDTYSRFEQDVFNVIKAMLPNEFSSDVLTVVYEKPKVLVTDSERLNNIEKLIKLGCIEDWEKLTILNPNLSEDEAKAKLARINEKQNLIVNKLTGGNNGNNQNQNNVNP